MLAAALLPLRFFLGAMFVYAGLDKLLDPSFFDPEAAASIQSQLLTFERFSPLAPLVHFVEPLAVPIGLLIALGEIAVGLGALTGLAYRLAALGGFVLAMMFFLTASWTIRPWYLGPDLPYAVGWLTLALAGHGGLLVPRLARLPAFVGPLAPSERSALTRRYVLQIGALAAGTLAVGSLAGGLRLLRGGSAVASSPSTSPTAAGGSPTPGPTTTPAGNQIVIAHISDIPASNAIRFRVPISAPSSLPRGDPGLLVRLSDGSFAAYDAICTHAGCRVGWDAQDQLMACPCHGALFDPEHHGQVLGGPAPEPLFELPLVIDQNAGTIALRG